jgi:hypothetical protein
VGVKAPMARISDEYTALFITNLSLGAVISGNA